MKQRLVDEWSDHSKELNHGEVTKKKDVALLEVRRSIHTGTQHISSRPKEAQQKQEEIGTPSYSLSFFAQIGVLMQRSFLQSKGVAKDILLFIQTIVVALVVRS